MLVKKAAIAAVSAAALVGLAACGGSGDTSSGDSPTFEEAGSSGSGQDPTRVDGPVEIDGATEGGTVTVMSANGLTTMDPTDAYYVNTGSILKSLIIRSLTQYVHDEETGEMILIPDLATDLGTPNKDFTEWKFELREGIKYENGDEVQPEDWIWGIKRSFDRDTFPIGAGFSNEYFIDGDTYKGPYTDPDAEWDGATVEGNTLTIKMSKPFPTMPYWGSFPAMSPMPEDASAPDEYLQHPLATGPYMFGDYTPGESLQLVRNPEWDPASDPGRTQYPDEYDMTFTEDSTAMDAKLIGDQGEAQTSLTFDAVLQSDWAAAQETGNTVTGGIPCTRLLYMDMRKITDINVRKAVGLAWPYKDHWLAGGDIVGVTRVPGAAVMAPGIPGRPDYENILGNGGEETDPAAAKQLLEEAGEVGFELDFLFAADDPIEVDQKNVVVEAFEEAGFKANPIASTINKLSTQYANEDTPINLIELGWCSDWPQGSSWIPPLFDKNGTNNYARFDEPEINKAIQDTILLPIEEQDAAWGALDEKITKDYYPVVNIGYYGNAMLHGSRIEGMFNDNEAGMPTWKNIWVAPEE